MTQKPLVYMVIAIAVGYILVSTIPQQLSMYTTPQLLIERGNGKPIESTPESLNDTVTSSEVTQSDSEILGSRDENRKTSFIQTSQINKLMMWWTIDLMIAIIIYWVAKQRLS